MKVALNDSRRPCTKRENKVVEFFERKKAAADLFVFANEMFGPRSLKFFCTALVLTVCEVREKNSSEKQ